MKIKRYSIVGGRKIVTVEKHTSLETQLREEKLAASIEQY